MPYLVATNGSNSTPTTTLDMVFALDWSRVNMTVATTSTTMVVTTYDPQTDALVAQARAFADAIGQERERHERDLRAFQEANDRRRDIYRAARARAHNALLSLLDEEQSSDYEAAGAFNVIGSMGGHYRIAVGYASNVTNNTHEFCIHPRMHDHEGHRLATEDVLIAQMLLITTDEGLFLEIANASPRS